MAYNKEDKRILNRLGYYEYQQGLIYRHLNQDKGWNSHLENCRNFILKSVEMISPSKVTILGSGWLLDIPLRELLDKTGSVVLVDIVQPPEAVKQVSGFRQVSVMESDVTGGLVREVWEKAGKIPFWKKLNTIGNISIPEFSFGEDPGLVISVNVLSQLHVLPERFLRKKSRTKEAEFIKFRKEVQEKHMNLLLKHKSVIITDICENFTGRDGKKTLVKTVEVEIPEGSYTRRWTWDFDLRRSDYYEKKSVLEVIASVL